MVLFSSYSLAGCPEATVSNIHSAAQSAVSHGALGMLVAHWSGVGHITHRCMAWPGLLVAAGLAWNSDISLVCYYYPSTEHYIWPYIIRSLLTSTILT